MLLLLGFTPLKSADQAPEIHLGELKLLFDAEAGVIALILRGTLTPADVDVVLSPILEAKVRLRAVRRPVRIMLVANSDANSGFEIASRIIGLRRSEDRLALVVGVKSVRDDLIAKLDGLPARVFKRSTEAMAWLQDQST